MSEWRGENFPGMKNTFAESAIFFVMAFVAMIMVSLSCKDRRTTTQGEEELILELSGKIIEVRKQAEGIKELEIAVATMEEELTTINEELKKRDPASAAVNAISFSHVTVLQVPEILDFKNKTPYLELGYVSFRVAGLIDDLITVFENVRSSSEIKMETAEISFSDLPELTTLSVIASYPISITIGENQATTAKSPVVTEEAATVTEENKIKKLEKILSALSSEVKKKEKLEKRREELENALKNFEVWREETPQLSHFIRKLPIRWPVGLPPIKSVKIQQNVISIWTQGYLEEITPFILETYEELSKSAYPALLNFNPMIPNLESKNLEERKENDRIILSWKGLPVYSIQSDEVLTMVRGGNNIYIVTPEGKAGDKKTSSSLVRSIRAVAIVSRAKLWEKILGGARTTNILLNSSGGLLYAVGERVFCLNAETGEELGIIAISGKALEIALGADDKLIVKTKKKDGSQNWISIQGPCK